MIVVSNSADQTLTPGQSIVFDTLNMKSGTGECCKIIPGTAVVGAPKLRHCGAVYTISFHGNVSSPTTGTNIVLAIAIDGIPVPITRMSTAVYTANTEFQTISISLPLRNGCGASSVTVTNVGTVDAIVQANAMLSVKRES